MYFIKRLITTSFIVKSFTTSLLTTCLMILSGCKGVGTGLAGSQDALSVCPPGGCSDLVPDQTQLNLIYTGKSTVYHPVPSGGGDSIEIGGSCYESTYPNNRIEVKVYQGTSNQINMGTTGITSLIPNQTTPKCKNGRFGIALNGSLLPAGAVYRVDLAMIGIDSTSQEFRNAGSGTINLSISR